MKKHIITYCRNCLKQCFVFPFLVLFFSVNAAAQTDSTIVPATEDADAYVEAEREEEVPYFNAKNNSENFTVPQRNVSEKAYKEIKADENFWYVDYKKTEKKTKQAVSNGSNGENGEPSKPGEKKNKKVIEEEISEYTPVRKRSWFQNLMLVIAIVGLAAIIGWYLASSNVGLFRKKDIKKNEDIDIAEEMPEDIFAINYQKEIDKAAADGNFRLAIRLQYLRLLKQFAEKNIIQYKQDKTNFDYLTELHSTQYYNSFFKITRNYEYSWYGKFDVSADAYNSISSDFAKLSKLIV